MLGSFLKTKTNDLAFTQIDYGETLVRIKQLRYMQDSALVAVDFEDGSEEMLVSEIDPVMRPAFDKSKLIPVGIVDMKGALIDEYKAELVIV